MRASRSRTQGDDIAATVLLTRRKPHSNEDGTVALGHASKTIVITKADARRGLRLWVVCLVAVRGPAPCRVGLHLVHASGHSIHPPMREEVLSAADGVDAREHRFSKSLDFERAGHQHASSVRLELRIDGVARDWCQIQLAP